MPISVCRSGTTWFVALCCGILASIGYSFTTDQGNTTLIDTILGLQVKDPLLRGLSVGATVLVLIKSKVLSIKGTEIGGELLYGWGRTLSVRSINDKWLGQKNSFVKTNLEKALTLSDFEKQISQQVTDRIKTEDEEFRTKANTAFTAIQRQRPSGSFEPKSNDWKDYYRDLMRWALEYGGSDSMLGWHSFELPKK